MTVSGTGKFFIGTGSDKRGQKVSTIIDVKHLEKYRENNRIEAKKSLGGLPKSLWETYSAFANTLGGIILLGVEERKDKSFLLHNLPDTQSLLQEFWSIARDETKVSVNILKEEHVQVIESNGKRQIAITVPRAERRDKPVYIGGNMFTGSYRRNGEGDYHCSREEIEAMCRDAGNIPENEQILEDKSLKVLEKGTILRYRNYMKKVHPGHIWEELSAEEFLEKIGAAGWGEDSKLHPTRAGLLMFGKESVISQVYPCYFLNYQEMSPQGIWMDLLTSDSGTWSGNLYDFYIRVFLKITKGVKNPAAGRAQKNSETPVHRAIREALVNCLVNADYQEKQGVIVQKEGNKITFENPGNFRVDREKILEESISDPRNPELIQMFHLIKAGNGTGSGIAEMYRIWKKQGWELPKIRESFQPDQIQVSLAIEKTSGRKRRAESGKCRRKKGMDRIIYESQKQQVIDYVTAEAAVKTKAVAELLDVPPSKAKEILARMVREEILVRKGGKQERTYQLKA